MDGTKTQSQKPIYIYTQHVSTINLLKETCGDVIVLSQNRSKDPVEDITRQVSKPGVLYAVLPVDQAVLLWQRTPLTIRLLQLDGGTVEKLTGQPYNPKVEYPIEILRQALRVIEIKDGSVRYYNNLQEMISEIINKGYRKIGVFNDTMREGMRMALQRIGITVELVKTCSDNDSCVELNPLGFKNGYRISLPGTAGRLTPEQIAEALVSGTARMYHVELTAEVVPLCERPES